MPRLPLALALLGLATGLPAAEFDTTLPMFAHAAQTYYVSGHLGDLGPSEFMIDTGASYLSINQDSLDQLSARGLAHYRRELIGRLADGSEVRVPLYRLSALRLGEACVLRDVEAAVFPGSTRQIIGLNVLNRAAPFIFSTNPPQLTLSHCTAGARQLSANY